MKPTPVLKNIGIFVPPVGEKITKEEHPFTIASSPLNRNTIQFVIRSCGDFTSRIQMLKPGDTLMVDGPYGQFSHVFLPGKTPVVMIAGGIGITPMLSMLRFMAQVFDDRPVVLIWSNKTKEHIVFAREFIEFARNMKHLTIHLVFTREAPEPGCFDRINEQGVRAMLNGVDRQTPVFLCGPPLMGGAVKKILIDLGFSSKRKNIYPERNNDHQGCEQAR